MSKLTFINQPPYTTTPIHKPSPYKICMEHKQMGRCITEEQKKEIQDRLFKSSNPTTTSTSSTTAACQPQKEKKEWNTIHKPSQSDTSPSHLYKLRLPYILN